MGVPSTFCKSLCRVLCLIQTAVSTLSGSSPAVSALPGSAPLRKQPCCPSACAASGCPCSRSCASAPRPAPKRLRQLQQAGAARPGHPSFIVSRLLSETAPWLRRRYQRLSGSAAGRGCRADWHLSSLDGCQRPCGCNMPGECRAIIRRSALLEPGVPSGQLARMPRAGRRTACCLLCRCRCAPLLTCQPQAAACPRPRWAPCRPRRRRLPPWAASWACASSTPPPARQSRCAAWLAG